MDNVRILKGYSKEEQKELEDDEEFVSCTTFINIITGYQPAFECRFIKDKYDNAREDEQILIIKDILDFYTDKAKFAEPTKYYIKMPKVDYAYLFKDVDGTLDWGNDFGVLDRKYFTEDEIKDIDPRYMAFAVPVEDDNE